MLICSGDIHPNPGPSSIASSLNSSTSHNHSNNSLRSLNLSHNLSFVHYNVQSILNEFDILEAELFEFDILAFTETWLNPTVQSDDLVFQTFHKPERKDRRSDHFGGMIVMLSFLNYLNLLILQVLAVSLLILKKLKKFLEL